MLLISFLLLTILMKTTTSARRNHKRLGQAFSPFCELVSVDIDECKPLLKARDMDIHGLTLGCFSLNYMQMIEEDIRTKEMFECVHDSLSYPIPYPIPGAGGTADFSDVLQEMCGVW